jgi:hypothetical protein
MKVAVCVASSAIPAWQRATIDALHGVDGVSVRVVHVDGPAWRPPNGADRLIAGSALEPGTVAIDGTDLGGDDVILNLGARELQVDAPHGVWSFRVGESNDGALPFAREFQAGAETLEIALVRRLGDEVAALRVGHFGLTFKYSVSVRMALVEAARWPATFLAALVAGHPLTVLEGDYRPSGPALRSAERVRFYAALGARVCTGVIGALTKVDRWNVGFASGGPRALISDQPLAIRWLPEPRPRSFLADPFVVERDGLRVLFAEDFDYVRDRGVIDALILDEDDRVVRRERALDLPRHVSYPFPLEIDGTLYLIPETSSANEIALYRCLRFPDRWERERALIPALDGVDTTLFEHDGRWWAFCTRASRGSCVALHAYHAASPRGPWHPHALNPIVVDVASARPAGPPFVLDGTLYRLGQDCSRTYGGAVVISRIEELTPATYHESFVKRVILGPTERFHDGIHTVSFCGEMLVVDGKNSYRDLRNVPRGLRALFGKRIRHVVNRTKALGMKGARMRG